MRHPGLSRRRRGRARSARAAGQSDSRGGADHAQRIRALPRERRGVFPRGRAPARTPSLRAWLLTCTSRRARDVAATSEPRRRSVLCSPMITRCMRRSLRLLLDGEEDVDVVAEADDLRLGDSPRPRPRSRTCSCSTSACPAGSSSRRSARCASRRPTPRSSCMTMDDDPVFAQRALAAGALGFVLEGARRQELPQAMRAAAARAGVHQPARRRPAGRAATGRSPRTSSRPRGRSAAADRARPHERRDRRKLHLSPRTVETHRAHIHRKLGLADAGRARALRARTRPARRPEAPRAALATERCGRQAR